MENEIRIAGEQGSLTIQVHRYERPGSNDKDDANWLRCDLTIKAGPFTGTFKAAFTTYDLITLAERLKVALTAVCGSFSFQNTEQDIILEITLDKRGAARLQGTAQPHRSLEASLAFRFDTDQTYLVQSLRQLEAVLRSFPVKQLQ